MRRFQEDENIPFFVLSLKAGGTGLNLTAASHVIHFDRWWNPAVENQATDRAFRSGRLGTCSCTNSSASVPSRRRSTQMIKSEAETCRRFLGNGAAELLLTELKDEELLNLVCARS